MQGYLAIGDEVHALTICPATGGGYRFADGTPLSLCASGSRMRVQVGGIVREVDIAVAGETVWIHLEGVEVAAKGAMKPSRVSWMSQPRTCRPIAVP